MKYAMATRCVAKKGLALTNTENRVAGTWDIVCWFQSTNIWNTSFNWIKSHVLVQLPNATAISETSGNTLCGFLCKPKGRIQGIE